MGENNRRKILVAVDESNESTYALSWCLKNLVSVQNSNDTLILLFAKTPVAVHTAMDSSGYMFTSNIIASMEKYGKEVAEHVMHKAKQVCKDLNDHVTVEIVVEHGDPRDVICEVAERLKVDILVMGSHGYGAIKRAFLGSVSNHCAQKVKCPVLIVKKPKSNAADH
ncbi:hypothetical protein ACJIZ3_015905 [Penstemon smallii]|uniref:UspA domain-containing protein n=1 Tax=Penstemon smallii TaxID=265156 RepID=A0ABD3RNU6_9LAMI